LLAHCPPVGQVLRPVDNHDERANLRPVDRHVRVDACGMHGVVGLGDLGDHLQGVNERCGPGPKVWFTGELKEEKMRPRMQGHEAKLQLFVMMKSRVRMPA
jgi:hypothetical protein